MSSESRASKNVIWFFVITILFSWALWIPLILFNFGLVGDSVFIEFLQSPFNIAAFGPTVAAVIMVLKEDGVNGLKSLLKQGAKTGFDRKWFVPVFLLFPAIFLSAMLIGMVTGFVPDLEMLLHPEVVLIGFFVVLLTAGPLQEEFGWRGYATPRLQERHFALVSSIFIGVVWALWHLPLFFVFAPGEAGMYYQQPIWIMMVSIVFSSIIFSWVYNNTDGSVFATLLLHTSLNWFLWVFLPLQSYTVAVVSTAIIVIVAVGIALYSGPHLKKKWTRDL